MPQQNCTHRDTIAKKLYAVSEVLYTEYNKQHSDPWVIAYSGGKDSTLLLQLVWEALLSVPEQKRTRNILVVGNDTLVESPLVINHLKNSIKNIQIAVHEQKLPIKAQMTEPYIDQTFWVNIIGRGYMPPTRNFRWCTDRMKITPTNRLLQKLTKQYGQTVLLVGTRKSESQNRRRTMEKHGVKANAMNSHSLIKDCRVFSPLADLDNEDVWKILLQRDPPWGGTHHNLITLYRNAGSGECPLVLTKEDAPSCGTTSPRFGCWTCTVVKKDKSMRGIIDSRFQDYEKLEALADFRDWLIELREDCGNRLPVRRDGKTKLRSDGTRVMGPFKLAVRRKILTQLERLQEEYGERLISPTEKELIHDIWWRDKVCEDVRQGSIK